MIKKGYKSKSTGEEAEELAEKGKFLKKGYKAKKPKK